jgi:hypothetical protein
MAQTFSPRGLPARAFLEPLRCLLDGQAFHDQVLDIVLDRAVLLSELPDAVLPRFAGERGDVLDSLKKAVLSARRIVGFSDDPRRFLPQSSTVLLSHSDLPWSEVAQLSRPRHWTWPEVVSARGSVCAFSLGMALEQIFEPEQFKVCPSKSFEDRCVHSDCSHLILRIDLPSGGSLPPRWEGRPCARIELSKKAQRVSSLHSVDSSLWRFPAHLTLEHGVRVMAGSIIKSWKCYRSGLWAWGSFIKAACAHRPHFEVDITMLAGFASFFSNGATFSHYVGHLRFGMRLLGISWQIDNAISAALFRGARKFHVRADLPRLLQSDVLKLVRTALQAGHVEVARIMVIARCFLFRVEGECFPLQANGRQSLPHESRAWHSVIVDFPGGVEVQLRSRKNAPDGDVLRRSCSCKKIALLCGPCALRAQVKFRAAQLLPKTSGIFSVSSAHALRLIRQWCTELSIECPGWHSFRRGMASDLLTSGQTISVILQQGGWKSGAFLKYLRLRDVDEREALDFTMDLSDQE